MDTKDENVSLEKQVIWLPFVISILYAILDWWFSNDIPNKGLCLSKGMWIDIIYTLEGAVIPSLFGLILTMLWQTREMSKQNKDWMFKSGKDIHALMFTIVYFIICVMTLSSQNLQGGVIGLIATVFYAVLVNSVCLSSRIQFMMSVWIISNEHKKPPKVKNVPNVP